MRNPTLDHKKDVVLKLENVMTRTDSVGNLRINNKELVGKGLHDIAEVVE